MGLILDSSVLISAERKGKTVRQILEQLRAAHGETNLGLSVVTVAELVHGAYRAQTAAQQVRRSAFIDELCRDILVYRRSKLPEWQGEFKASRRRKASAVLLKT